MKNQIIGILILQYILGGIYLFGIGLWDSSALLSALLGCGAALLPKTYFGYRIIRATDGSKDAAQWLGYAYRSEIGKWVLLALIFWVAFSTDYPWDPVVLFAGFVLIQISGSFAPMVIKGN